MTTICQLLVLGATALALSTQPSRAGPCAQDIDRDLKMQVRWQHYIDHFEVGSVQQLTVIGDHRHPRMPLAGFRLSCG